MIRIYAKNRHKYVMIKRDFLCRVNNYQNSASHPIHLHLENILPGYNKKSNWDADEEFARLLSIVNKKS